MRSRSSSTPTPSAPQIIKDWSRFSRGFLFGSFFAVAAFAAVCLIDLYHRPTNDLQQALAVMESPHSPAVEMAIARAEELNLAAAAYVANCGPDLAARAWREAGGDQERYQLLSSFIAFSPESLAEYAPGDFEIELWDELGADVSAQKVVLISAGRTVAY